MRHTGFHRLTVVNETPKNGASQLSLVADAPPCADDEVLRAITLPKEVGKINIQDGKK